MDPSFYYASVREDCADDQGFVMSVHENGQISGGVQVLQTSSSTNNASQHVVNHNVDSEQ